MDIKDLLGSDPKAQFKFEAPRYGYDVVAPPPRQQSTQVTPNFPLHGSAGLHASQTPHPQSLPAPTPILNSNDHYYRRQSTSYPIKAEPTEPPAGWSRYEPPPPRFSHQGYSYESAHPPIYVDYMPNKRSSSFEELAAKRQRKGKGANQKWDAEEDAKIIELRGTGMKWGDIAKSLPGRTEIACRLHYQNYLEKRGEWDEEKKTKLARVYERLKAELWQPIASELGVPWRNAEAMHWTLGERDMARRANTTPFSILSGTNSAGPQGEGHGRIAQASRMQDTAIYFEPAEVEQRLRSANEALSPGTGQSHPERRPSFQSVNTPQRRGYEGVQSVDYTAAPSVRSTGSSSVQVSPTTSDPRALPAINTATTLAPYQQQVPAISQATQPSTNPDSSSCRLPPIEHLNQGVQPQQHLSQQPQQQHQQQEQQQQQHHPNSSIATSTPIPSVSHHRPPPQEQQQPQINPQPHLYPSPTHLHPDTRPSHFTTPAPNTPHPSSYDPKSQQPHSRPRSSNSATGSDGSDRLLALADISTQQHQPHQSHQPDYRKPSPASIVTPASTAPTPAATSTSTAPVLSLPAGATTADGSGESATRSGALSPGGLHTTRGKRRSVGSHDHHDEGEGEGEGEGTGSERSYTIVGRKRMRSRSER